MLKKKIERRPEKEGTQTANLNRQVGWTGASDEGRD